MRLLPCGAQLFRCQQIMLLADVLLLYMVPCCAACSLPLWRAAGPAAAAGAGQSLGLPPSLQDITLESLKPRITHANAVMRL